LVGADLFGEKNIADWLVVTGWWWLVCSERKVMLVGG
jgi:hypothetical protein